MLNLVLSLSLSHTGHWKFNMAPHGNELSEDLKKKQRIVALHKDGVGYKKIAKTLKLSCSTMAKTIQQLNRTGSGSNQNRPRHIRPNKLNARAQRHIQRLCLGNRRMSASSIAAEVEGLGGQPVGTQTIRRTLDQIGLHGCRPKMKPILKMIHKKACKQIQNAAARLVFNEPKRAHVTPLFVSLHWLPVAARIQFKTLMLAYRTITGSAPTYFHSLLRTYIPSRSLRSASERRLVVPSQRGSKSLSRTFSFTAPGRWNDLPTPIRNAGSLSIFKQQLKTHLFQLYLTIYKKKKKKKILFFQNLHLSLLPLLACTYLNNA